MDNIKKEFSRNAIHYDKYNQIQKKVALHLLEKITSNPGRIVDIGSGKGEVFKHIKWDVREFIAIDFSKEMCDMHPKSEKIKVITADFNNSSTYEIISDYGTDYIVSASALQWAEDLNFVFKKIAEIKKPVALALFTSNTFYDLHKKTGIKSPLHTKEDVIKSAKRFLKANFEVKKFALEFASTKEMFEYIKKSGVSSGERNLSVAQVKNLIREDELKKVEAEVVFIFS